MSTQQKYIVSGIPNGLSYAFFSLILFLFAFSASLKAELALVGALFFALFLPYLWAGRSRFFLFLFLSFFIQLIPGLGVDVAGRVLNWFDIFLLGFGAWNAAHVLKNGLRIDTVLKGSLIFLGCLFILVFRSSDFAVSSREWVSYVVNFFLTYWIMERFTRREFQTLLGAGLVSSCFVSLVALWQKLNHFSFASTEDGEATIRLGVPGTFDDSLVLSMVAGFFCIVAVIFVLRSRTTGERVLGLVSIAANLLSLKLALSRNGMFILVVGLCVFLIFRFGSWMKDRRSSMRIPVVMVFLPLFMVGSLWLLPADVYYRITSVFYLFSGSRDPVIVYNIRSTLGRFENYKSALKLFIENPVEGIGLGLYPYLTKFEDADGFYTGLLAETGLIGFLSFLVFAFLMLRSLYLSKSNYTDSRDAMCHELFFALTVALMLVSFFEPVFKIQVMTFYYFLLLKNYVSSSKEGYDEA